MAERKNSKNHQTDEELLGFIQDNESCKVKVRFFENEEAEIETDTLEEAKEARARLRK